MLTFRRFVALSKAKVDNINRVFSLVVTTNEEIVRFDISVDDAFLMHSFYSLYHLMKDVKASPEVKLSPAFLKLVLKTLAEQVHHHHMVHFAVLCFLVTNKMQIRHCCLSSQLMNEL